MAESGVAFAEVSEFVREDSAKFIFIQNVQQRQADLERFFPPTEDAEAGFLDHAGVEVGRDENAVERARFATNPPPFWA